MQRVEASNPEAEGSEEAGRNDAQDPGRKETNETHKKAHVAEAVSGADGRSESSQTKIAPSG